MGQDNDNGDGFQFRQRDTSTKWEKFQKAIYDPSSKAFLGRTPKNWGQLLLFYAIFYVVLAALFAICMQGLFASLPDKEPRWKLQESLIGNNPGLGFRPISSRAEEGSLITYNMVNASSVERWIGLVEDFLAPYKRSQVGDNFVSCNFNQPPPAGKVCSVQLEHLGNCAPDNGYGYKTASPCIFLKLNRIFDWKPDCHTEPLDEMPEDLKTHILNINSTEERKQVWVSCKGENNVDKEAFRSFDYQPRGFASYYYPFNNARNYLSPLIAVTIKNPSPLQTISIECRAWAKNIEYNGGAQNRKGSVKFEIRVDTKTVQQQQPTTTTTPNTAS